ncbi:peptidase inhibitor family I36 protein [Allokutzneria multivorans]
MSTKSSLARRMGNVAKVLAVGGALASTLFAAVPAQASEEASLPTRTVTKYYGDGKVTTSTEPDYAKAKSAALQAKAAFSCPVDFLCMYQHENGGGAAFILEDPGSGRNGHDDFSKVRCDSCGGSFNDQMSSFVNKTSKTWYWYFDKDGYGEQHNMNWTDKPFNLVPREHDKASSVYSWR